LREKWCDYLGALLSSRPVRAAAKQLQVHRNTAFLRCHRFLDRVKENRPVRLNDIAEADEMFLLESQKGARKLDRAPRRRAAGRRSTLRELDCILVTRDRSGQTVDAVTGRGAVSREQLERHLLPYLDRQVLLMTDSNAAYRAFARADGIAHQAVNLRAGEPRKANVAGAIHVQNVNGYYRRLRSTRIQLTTRRLGRVAGDSQSGLLRDWLVGSRWTISESNYRSTRLSLSISLCF